MKFNTLFTLCIFASSVASSVAFAKTDSCPGNGYIEPGMVNMSCNGGFCFGDVGGTEVDVSGSCSGAESFTAGGYWSGGSIQGVCSSGSFSGSLPLAIVSWNGQCTGGDFSAPEGAAGGQPLFGTCALNGNFLIEVPPMSIGLNGQCSVQ
jgi:hypothetical protein